MTNPIQVAELKRVAELLRVRFIASGSEVSRLPLRRVDVLRATLSIVMAFFVSEATYCGELQLRLTNAERVTFVGAFRRWDADGNPLKPVNPKAKIETPEVDAQAESNGDGVWTLRKLSPGRYDLVLLAKDRVRIEGFHFPPIAEFDPALPSNSPSPPDEVRDWIRKDIANARHYENKVTPLFMTGDRKQVRVFMQLLRDDATSFDADFGAPVATLRHEFWQYTNRTGGWVKERKTKVVDRVLSAKSEMRHWTWVWIPELGGIEITDSPIRISYQLPRAFKPESAAGLVSDVSRSDVSR